MASTLDISSITARAETPDTQTFTFELDNSLDYQPGQYVTLKLADVDDPRGPQRPFTLSSSPTEKKRIAITLRQTGSPFKKALQQLAEQQKDISDQIKVRGPMGDFTLDTERAALMIAGGIGITPFRSMIRDLYDRGVNIPVVLLYSNRTAEDIAFRDELDDIAGATDWLTVIHTLTQSDETDDNWRGRTERIDGELVSSVARQLADPIYYICGPTNMVTALVDIVQGQLEVPEGDIRFEKFSGY